MPAQRYTIRRPNPPGRVDIVAGETLDVNAMIERFRARARAVRSRGLPPIEGPERKRFLEQMQLDFQDYAMLGDATGSLDDGILTLRVDLRPKADPEPDSPA